MDELIVELVTDYNEDRITWHDIQDIVGGYIAKTYGVIDYNTDRDKWREVHRIENDILQAIEAQIYQHE